MKKILAFCIYFVSIQPLLFAKKNTKTKVQIIADDDYKPYTYKDSRVVKGIYIDILKELAKDENLSAYDIEIVTLPWKRALNMLKTGKGFALVPPYFRYKERPYIWPYSLPLLQETLVLYCNKKSAPKNADKIFKTSNYFGLTFGKNVGFSSYELKEFQDALKNKKIKIEESKGTRTNLIKLSLGRTDCYANDSRAIFLEQKKLIKSKDIKKGSIVKVSTISKEDGFIAYTASNTFPFKDDFVKRMDIAIHNLKKLNKIDSIVEKYINSSQP